jgi:hypothetical protein
MNKLLLSASALAFGLAISGAAMAGTGGNSGTATASGGSSASQTTVNATGNLNHDGNTKTIASDNNILSPNNNTVASGNTVASNDGGNTSTKDGNDANNNQSVNVSKSKTDTTNASLSDFGNTSTSVTFSGPLTEQSLDATVNGAVIHAHSGIVTGAIALNGAGSDSTEFAGIQTVGANTGIESNAQAATAVSASSGIEFNGN